MARLVISLLGPFQVTLDGNQVTSFGSDAARALLAYLAMHAGVSPRREVLAGLLWPDRPEVEAQHNLAQALYTLRTAIGDRSSDAPLLNATRHTVGFELKAHCWLDVAVFVDAVSSSEQHRHRSVESCGPCMRRLQEAADLYRGELLAGFSLDSAPFEEWLVVQREELHRQALGVLHSLAIHHERRAEYEQALTYAKRQVGLEPWREDAHRQCMRLLAYTGARQEALVQYDTCRRALRQELDVDPEPETVALYQRIRDGMELPLPAPLALHNLPASLSPFVGRERELAELDRLLAGPQVRLATVVGAGGMGKTRLALEAAHAALDRYPGGVRLVELAPVPDGDSVPRAVAAVLGVQEQPSQPLPETIAAALQGRELLLLLDNCEHVLDGVAPLAALLLARCPELALLATSRKPLRIAGEHLYDLPPMALPETADEAELLAADAVQLFRQRAAAVRPGFALGGDNLAAVAGLCRRLDGMPLAIELAAARLRALSLPELARHLDDRFHLLTGGDRAALPRQQTLRSTVAWSYDLLGAGERLLFDRLSVFAGSFSLQGAEEVCSGEGIAKEEVLDLLAGLVDQSLVGRVEGPEGSARYRLLETLRAYGQERLAERGETEQVAARHAWYYVSFVEALDPVLLAFEREAIAAFRRVDAEDENLAAAMRWSLAHGRPEVTMRIGAALPTWLLCRGHYSTQYDEWLRAALQQGQGVAPRYQARALACVADFHWNRGRRGSELAALAQAELERAQASGDANCIGRALYDMGRVAAAAGDTERARACYHESLALARQCGDRLLACCDSVLDLSYEPLARRRVLLEGLLEWALYGVHAWVHQILGEAAWALGDLAGARASLQASSARWVEFGLPFSQEGLTMDLAEIDLLRGDYASAEHLILRGMDMERRVGSRYLVWATQMMGRLAWQHGHLEQAWERLEEGLRLACQESMARDAALYRVDLALIASERGEYERAEALCAEALPDLPPGDIWTRAGGNWARGHALLTQARVALGRGQGARAVALCREALGWVQQAQFRPEIVDVLEPLAWALAVEGRAAEAARLLALAGREREEMGIVLPPVDRPHRERALEGARAALGEEEFAAAWAEGRARDLEEAVRELLLEQGQGDGA